MGEVASCACASEPCKSAGCDVDNLQDSWIVRPSSPWTQTEDLEVSVLDRHELDTKLKQLAYCEESKHHVPYATILRRVLDLLAGSLANVAGSAAFVVVAPEREIASLEVDYSDEGHLTDELAGVSVTDDRFEKSLSSCAWQYSGEVDQHDRPTELAFVVDHRSGQVLAASAFFPNQVTGLSIWSGQGPEHMNAVDLASSMTRGVVFTRSRVGIVNIYAAAEVQWGRALELASGQSACTDAAGGSIELAVMLDNIGSGHLQKGNPAAAKQLHERALRIQEKHYGPNHVQVGVTLDNLGIAHTELGNPEYAKELLKRALDIHETHFGSDHVQVAWTLDNLGSCLRDLGELRQAQFLHERALTIYEAEYGKDNVRLGRTLNALGHTHRGLGNPAAARPFYQAALVAFEAEIEPDDAQVAICYNNLGNAVRELGDVQHARTLYENALKIAEGHLGATHDEVGRTLNNLGLAHLELGNPTEAKRLFARALDIFEARFGSRSAYGAMVRTNMATCLAVLGHKKEAKDCVLKAEAAVDATGGTVCLELELRAAAVRFAVGDIAHPTPQERWNKSEGQIQDLLGPSGMDEVCARCKEGLVRSWQHTNRQDVVQWLRSRGTARI